jgi:hypothetical protein
MGSPTATLLRSAAETSAPKLERVPSIAASADETGATFELAEVVGAELPLLLAGPVVRWVAHGGVNIWVATSVPMDVTARIYDAFDSAAGVLAEGTARPDAFGSSFYTCLVHVAGRFPRRRVLAYDLEFHAPPHYQFQQDSPGFIARSEIACGPYGLPTFLTPPAPGGTQARFAHGSCRKPHATGMDATLRLNGDLDGWASGESATRSERPMALFLTGDQIYADDVDADLLHVVRKLQPLLLGFPECVPEGSPVTAGAETRDLGPGSRAAIVRGAGLTVDEEVAGNHLLAFGEFVAAHLVAWSPELWDGWVRQHLPGIYAAHGEWVASARAMRRVLANLPTYMMRDDHEVTDDWPMAKDQVAAVKLSPAGRWLTTNGLAAVWVMQLKGNYASCPAGRTLERHLHTYLAAGLAAGESPSGAQKDSIAAAGASYAWNAFEAQFRTSATGTLLGTGGFTYEAPTSPPVIMLDTRTERELWPAPTPPALLSGDALGNLAARVARIHRLHPGAPVLVVTPAPAVGHYLAEVGQRAAMAASASQYYAQDCEAWGLCETALFGFFKALLGSPGVVFFSGDVHYGYAAGGVYSHPGGSYPYVQLTASPLKNPPGLSAAALDARAADSVALGLHDHWELGGPVDADSVTARFSLIDGHITVRENHYATVSIRWGDAEHTLRVSTTYLGLGVARSTSVEP